MTLTSVPCPLCDGEGELSNKDSCWECNGTGVIRVDEFPERGRLSQFFCVESFVWFVAFILAGVVAYLILKTNGGS